MSSLTASRHVLLVIEASSGFTRRLIRGVTAYSQAHGPWMFTLHEGEQTSLDAAFGCQPAFDGVIARTERREVHEQITLSKVPFVNVGGTRFGQHVPWVTVNNQSIVRLVVQEFRNHDHSNFAFVGPQRSDWGCQREIGFRQKVLDAAGQFHGSFFMKIVVPDELEETQRLRKWLKMLPKPIAVMAANDFCGHRLLNACQDEAINVPEQVAVIGVNNDELVCELCFPTLTSVSTNTEQVGHKAAEVLDQLMAGATFTQRKIEIEPLGIEPRQSTDRTAGADPFVVLAFRFIQQHACDGINVEDVLKVVPMSRSLLESSFRQLIGRSPHHEISRIRIERARRLLQGSELKVAEIAKRCGFSTVEYFSAAFKKEVGVSPSEFRRPLFQKLASTTRIC